MKINDKAWDEFRVSTSSPPDSKLQVRGGLLYWLPEGSGQPDSYKGWDVVASAADFSDPGSVNQTVSFVNLGYYKGYVVCLGLSTVTSLDPQNPTYILRGDGVEYATAAEAENALSVALFTEKPWWHGYPLCGVILKAGALTIDRVNRGRSYLFLPDLRPFGKILGTVPPRECLIFHTTRFTPLRFIGTLTKTGDLLFWDMGDGSAEVNDNSVTHIYTLAGTKTVTLCSIDGWTGVTSFYMFTDNLVGTFPSLAAMVNLVNFSVYNNLLTGTLPSFTACVLLEYFQCGYNQFTNGLPSFAACVLLDNFYCDHNQFTGALPSFATCTRLEYFWCNSNQFAGLLPSFSACTLLYDFECNDNQFTGTLPSFNTCTVLSSFNFYNNQFSGIIPDFSACVDLIVCDGHNNQFTGYTAGGFATQQSCLVIQFQTNLLTQAAVDAILADCVTSLGIPGRVNCTLSLHGVGNAAPSVAGLADKATLVAAGWVAWTN